MTIGIVETFSLAAAIYRNAACTRADAVWLDCSPGAAVAFATTTALIGATTGIGISALSLLTGSIGAIARPAKAASGPCFFGKEKGQKEERDEGKN